MKQNTYLNLQSPVDQVLSGHITSGDVRSIVEGRVYSVLDLSGATFEKGKTLTSGNSSFSHGRVVCEKPSVNDALRDILGGVFAYKILLPAKVGKRQIKALSDNPHAYDAAVPNDCKLFYMKDGNICERKTGEFVFVRKVVHKAPCACCQRVFDVNMLHKTGDEEFVCDDCAQGNEYAECIYCGELFKKSVLVESENLFGELCCALCKDVVEGF